MQIVHLCSYATFSGPLPGVLGLAHAQRALGHTVWVAHDRRRGDFSPFEEAAEPHLAAEAKRLPVRLSLAPRRRPWAAALDVVRLRRWLKTGEVDVVHAHQSHDHALILTAGKIAALRVRTLHAVRSLPAADGQKGRLARLVWGASDALVARCQADLRAMAAAVAAPLPPCAVIDGGFAGAAFAQAAQTHKAEARRWRRQRGIAEGALAIGHVALMAERGKKELLAAVARLCRTGRDVHVVMVGRGPCEDALNQQAHAQGLNGRVHWLGYVQTRELPRIYAALDAAFVGRLGNDGSGRAALEALCANVPLVAHNEPALAELFAFDSVFACDVICADAIFMALTRWLERACTLAPACWAARAWAVKRRSFAAEAERTLALYERAWRAKRDAQSTHRR